MGEGEQMSKKKSLLDGLGMGEEKNNVAQDTFDKLIYEDIQKESSPLKEQVSRGAKILGTFPELAQDVFASLYKNEPRLTKQVPYGTELNRKQVETFMDSDQYPRLRDYTTLDDYSAALASITVLTEVATRLEEDEEMRKAAEEQNKQNQNKEPQTPEERQQQQQQAKQRANQLSSKIRRAVNAGMAKATKEAEENSDAMAAMGWGDEASEFKKVPFQDKQVLMERFQMVKQVAKYIGRMRNLAMLSRSEKIKSTQVELCGVTFGDNVAKALPQELASLIHPVLKFDFYRKLAEKQLLQYELKRNEKRGKGHVICLLDDSGSMYNGDINLQAKGALFGLMECARLDKRNFAANIFASTGDEYKREYKEGKISPADAMDLLSVSFGGGTDYDGPMRWALEMSSKAEYKNADIIIITDGQCKLGDAVKKQVLKAKKDIGLKVHAIMIDCCGCTNDLKEWCNSIYTNLDSDTMEDVMSSL